MNRNDPNIRSALAAEYALGTLSGAAGRRFARLVDDAPDLQSEVERWEANLYRLLDGLPVRVPPASVWRRIENELGFSKAAPPVEHLRSQPTPPVRPDFQRVRLRDSLNFWRGWSLAASAAAVVLAVALVLAPSSMPVTYMVVVTDDALSQASWVVSGRPGSNEIRVRAVAPQSLPEDRVFQLWVLPAGATRVQSVGLIPASGNALLTTPESVASLLSGAQKFGVSIEPPGGSPTGQPTTTPLYHGKPLML